MWFLSLKIIFTTKSKGFDMKKSLRHLRHLEKLSRKKHDTMLNAKKVKTKKILKSSYIRKLKP